ncbi:MAG: divergent polysaccharide deacetylase family protein [Bacillota bacterium]
MNGHPVRPEAEHEPVSGRPARPVRARAVPEWLPGALGLLVFVAVVGGSVQVLYRWQLEAYPAWATRMQENGGPPVPLEESSRAGSQLPSPARMGSDLGQIAPGRPGVARLAIVIDDWGYNWQAAQRFFSLDAPLTVAVIPFLPYSRQQAQMARQHGFEVLVHLPMEPLDGRLNPGPGAITTALSDEEIRQRVERAIDAVPGAVGVSNHMGSRATADERVMAQVLTVVARRGLFFLDSHTNPRSVVGPIARRLGIAWARNDLFLDGEQDFRAVRSRLELAAARARRDGQAIAIGHVKPSTAAAVASVLPELRRMGVEVLPASRLLQR